MPELPEVETTRHGISPWITGRTVTGVIARRHALRWPLPDLAALLPGRTVQHISRRAKYLLLTCDDAGTLLIHLGMSGSLRILPTDTAAQTHDHLDIQFDSHCLRLRDPRRFGAVLWTEELPAQHPLLRHLGPEPLSAAFNADYLYACARSRRTAIKTLLMNGKVVVGVGNIYATEALYAAGIHPNRAACRITHTRLARLVNAVQQILRTAIQQGGTTLRDFQQEDGKPGYFRHQLQVYGRADQPCYHCQTHLQMQRIGQRSSVYCPNCQH
jgi:formamidopyrimidine-DNA glycosylase